MAQTPTAALVTLGCKLNLAESQAIGRSLGQAGYRVVEGLCEADAVVLNTCSVTHVADQKSRRLVRSARRAAPGAAIAVTGCYPRSAGVEAAIALGADFVAAPDEAGRAALVAFLGQRRGAGTREAPPPRLQTRAFIAAQSGCNDVCAFCIVPWTRGREVSRTAEAVAAEVNEALAAGANEVVITGTQLGAWGRDLEPRLGPERLIGELLERTEAPRVRFSSLQPQDITPGLLALWRDPRLMPHFHLALQAGSDTTLAAMRRRYTVAQYRDAVARIRAAVGGVAITTDVIAGFPGEGEAAFEETLDLCREVGFARVHCFPYSPRSRTSAARLADQVPVETRRARMQRLLALAGELAAEFRGRARGQVRPVLWEGERQVGREQLLGGYTDNYIQVFTGDMELTNRITPALLGEPLGDGLRASARAAA
jgi:threonylcarbamoyladenosine tRNA methylthiotransferase MtaB